MTVTLVLLCLVAVQDDKVDGPGYQVWSKHKIGTWEEVRFQDLTENRSKFTRHKLVEITDEKAVVESVTLSEDGTDSPFGKDKISLIHNARVPKPVYAEEILGEEKETVAGPDGKDFECRRVKLTRTWKNGSVETFTIWYTDAVPGGQLKSTYHAVWSDKSEHEAETMVVAFGFK